DPGKKQYIVCFCLIKSALRESKSLESDLGKNKIPQIQPHGFLSAVAYLSSSVHLPQSGLKSCCRALPLF
uniref:Uncharacterized protein n=4 Tax=Aegilops tauschii TaxID=37682 RepID=A0A453E5P1_AEGTS